MVKRKLTNKNLTTFLTITASDTSYNSNDKKTNTNEQPIKYNNNKKKLKYIFYPYSTL